MMIHDLNINSNNLADLDLGFSSISKKSGLLILTLFKVELFCYTNF